MKYTNDNLINVLANRLADICAFVSLDFEVKEYQQAKKELNKLNLCDYTKNLIGAISEV